MKTVLFISPHLDDAAFSCGGTILKMARRGWRTILCTIFTASVPDPTDFALACQLDKGLDATVDYMRLRRAEDVECGRLLEVSEVVHLPLPEAPHRKYNSAPELFDGMRDGDNVWLEIFELLQQQIQIFSPQIIFVPQGIGNHVDHLQTIRAVSKLKFNGQIWWYRDTPYTIRRPDAPFSELLPDKMQLRFVDIDKTIVDKIAACAAYKTQIKFQFGDENQLREKLGEFHHNETQNLKRQSCVELFLKSLSHYNSG